MEAKQKPIILVTSHRKPSPKGGSFSSVAVDDSYIEAIRSNGAIPLIVPLGLKKNELPAVADIAHGLFIPGGIDICPTRYGSSRIHEKTGRLSFEKIESAT